MSSGYLALTVSAEPEAFVQIPLAWSLILLKEWYSCVHLAIGTIRCTNVRGKSVLSRIEWVAEWNPLRESALGSGQRVVARSNSVFPKEIQRYRLDLVLN